MFCLSEAGAKGRPKRRKPGAPQTIIGPAPLRKCVGDFCLIFGGFCRGFSWRIFLGTFPRKNEGKNPATRSAKKSGSSITKIREKSVLPRSGPN